jgi:adenine-specific DNA-methyltransferase
MSEMDEVIAEGSEQEILYDDPEVVKGVTRVSGPFTVEAVMPPEQSLSDDDSPIGGAPAPADATFDVDGSDGGADTRNADAYLEKMTHLMEKDGIRFMDNKEMEFSRLDRMEGGTYLHAEGAWEGGNGEERVAISFGPEHGPVTGKQAVEAMREAYQRGYDVGVFAGFSFDDAAQKNIQEGIGRGDDIEFHMAHIRPDVVMEDLLYSPEKEQIFTVFGLPRTSLKTTETGGLQIEMEGVDVYDPVEGQINATDGSKVAAWFVDTDYDGRTFCICQAFFPNSPKRSPWKQFKQDLSDKIDGEKLNQLSGTTSLPFEAGEHECAAVKVIDPRGNEVMRVLDLS